MNNHKKQCLLINECQALNYESGTIKFTNYQKQGPIPFKIYERQRKMFFKKN